MQRAKGKTFLAESRGKQHDILETEWTMVLDISNSKFYTTTLYCVTLTNDLTPLDFNFIFCDPAVVWMFVST